jgi:hypothetical protein
VFGKVQAQTATFNDQPRSKTSPSSYDPYDGNDLDFPKIKTNMQVVGLLHRASIGMRDEKYLERSVLSNENKLKYASYHLGRKGNPSVRQIFILTSSKTT